MSDAKAVVVTDEAQKIAYNVGETASALGVNKSLIYHKISTGELRARRVFGRVVVLAEDVRRVVAEAPPRPPRSAR